MDQKSHYPDYDVLSLKNEWDDTTRKVVLQRLGPFPVPQFLSEEEEKMLRVITGHLVYDNRDYIFDWVIYYVDQRLQSEIGESQRKPNSLAEKDLIRAGLGAIEKLSYTTHNKSFTSLETKEQFDIVASLQLETAAIIPEWETVPQKDLFKKMLELIITAYYSHPVIWSEIGYGGPAYPRGYYRIELGWTDPWEPKMKEANSSGSYKEGR